MIERKGYGGAADLAREAGRTQAGINHMSLPGYEFGSRAARSLERALGLPHMYFDLADSPAAAGGLLQVPVMSWDKIGRHPVPPDVARVPVGWPVGGRCLAAVSRGTMSASDGLPGVPAGWHVIIDPDASTREGDIVCVWMPGATEATLRHYLTDGGEYFLYPLDRRHSTVEPWTKGVMLVGPVVGAMRYFR